MIRSIFVVIMLASVTLIGCSSPTPIPTQIPPTPTPTFEKKRTDVVIYLSAYNKIDNDLNVTISALGQPNSSDLLAINRWLDQYLVAAKGAQSRLMELQPPLTELRTVAHLSRAKALMGKSVTALTDLKTAISSGDQTRVASTFNSFMSLAAEGLAVNVAIEALLTAYNISDSDVNYRYRGR